MPWCDQCDQRLEADELTDEGTCPDCGSEPLEHRKSPWYFKFMLVASVIYLGLPGLPGGHLGGPSRVAAPRWQRPGEDARIGQESSAWAKYL